MPLALAWETRHAAVQVSFGSLLVQRDQWDTYWGAKKIIFLIRDIDGPARTAASTESCRFAARRSPCGRFGVGISRAQAPTPRTRPLPSLYIFGNSLSQTSGLAMVCQSFGSRALWGAPSTGACGLGDYPILDLSQRTSKGRSASEKSK